MKNKKVLLGMAVLCCISVLAGCSKDSKGNGDIVFKNVPINSENDNEGTSGSSDNNIPEDSEADALISSSAVSGHVVEFSDAGCIISPIKTEDVEGGQLAIEAEPGYENEEDNIHIHYRDKCEFQLAKISIATGKVKLSDVDISHIKKKTSVMIYGEWRDDHNIEAARVIIERYE